MATVEIPTLRGPALGKREAIQLAEFPRPLRKALVHGDKFNHGKLEGKLFHWWMPSQTFLGIAENTLGPYTTENWDEPYQ